MKKKGKIRGEKIVEALTKRGEEECGGWRLQKACSYEEKMEMKVVTRR